MEGGSEYGKEVDPCEMDISYLLTQKVIHLNNTFPFYLLVILKKYMKARNMLILPRADAEESFIISSSPGSPCQIDVSEFLSTKVIINITTLLHFKNWVLHIYITIILNN